MVMGSLSNHFHGQGGREGREGELLSVGVSDSNQASIGPGNQLQIQQISNLFHRAAFLCAPTFYILSKGVPGSDKGICHFFAATFTHKTYKPPEFPCFAPNFQPKERSEFFSPFKNEIYFQFVAKLWQLCVKFCKDFSLCTMGLETCLCHTHEHHHHHLLLPEYQPETNHFLTVFRLTGSNISVIIIKTLGWIYVLHNRKKSTKWYCMVRVEVYWNYRNDPGWLT